MACSWRCSIGADNHIRTEQGENRVAMVKLSELAAKLTRKYTLAMPDLVRLYIRQCLLGLALGIVFSMLLVILNIANLGHLVGEVQSGWLAFGLLCVFNGIVFAGVQFGMTIIRMDKDDGVHSER